MSKADFNATAWRTTKNSVGGRWNWDRNNYVAAGISTTGVTVDDTQMAEIDTLIDDGNLSTGLFRKYDTRFIYILEP